MKKMYKWLVLVVVVTAILALGWQYDAALQKSLHEVESRIKKFESVDLFNHIESVSQQLRLSVDILNEKQIELQALEKELDDKFAIQERELKAQVKTIETKLQKLRSELSDGLTKIERNVSTIDSVVDEKFKTLWMMINNK